MLEEEISKYKDKDEEKEIHCMKVISLLSNQTLKIDKQHANINGSETKCNYNNEAHVH